MEGQKIALLKEVEAEAWRDQTMAAAVAQRYRMMVAAAGAQLDQMTAAAGAAQQSQTMAAAALALRRLRKLRQLGAEAEVPRPWKGMPARLWVAVREGFSSPRTCLEVWTD